MIILPLILPPGFSMCFYNDDWPDAPCFDQGPASHLEFNKAWAPYYDHKGSEWMETKRVEMNQSIEKGTMEKWVKGLENHNVYQYYLSRNEIQSSLPYDSFFVKYDPNFKSPKSIESFIAEQPPEWLWFVIGGLFMLGMILLIWRIRK
jgi:hypothetical protein